MAPKPTEVLRRINRCSSIPSVLVVVRVISKIVLLLKLANDTEHIELTAAPGKRRGSLSCLPSASKSMLCCRSVIEEIVETLIT